MRAFYLAGSIIMTAIILILAFENIQAACNYLNFFFYEVPSSTSPTMTIFFEAVIGICAGVFYTQFVRSMLDKSEDDEDEDY
ncbi:MAG: hypothetical protein ACD_63C00111G0001 [uncultured bacterium]|nr:MAG: hypothetical protein ACD_63C00111G0001 [uncultured bacterium]